MGIVAKKIKVLHIITRLIRGGGDENTLFTVNGLNKERYEVSILIGSGNDNLMLSKIAPHVRLITVPSMEREVNPNKDITALWQIYRHLKKNRYDIVHTHLAKGGILGRIASKMANIPIIIHTIHGITFHKHLPNHSYFMYWSLEKFTSIFTSKYISVGQELQDYYLSAKIGTKENSCIIRSGMNLSAFKKASKNTADYRNEIRKSMNIPTDVPLVGNVARLVHGKGHEYFLEMARQVLLVMPQTHFAIIGDGELEDHFKNIATKLGIESQVHFTGYRSDIADVISSLDVLTLTSFWEGLPRVIVQGNIVGIPSVAFEVGGIKEVIKDSITGFIVPSKDCSNMAKKVLNIISDKTLSAEMGKNAQAIIGENFSIESMVRLIEDLYESQLKQIHQTTAK